MDNVGENVKRFRRYNAMTQTELAEKAGLTVTALSRIERGEASPRASTLRKLAEALGVHTREFFDE
jgi:transcriptional regulator with XRE-family HTH domain